MCGGECVVGSIFVIQLINYCIRAMVPIFALRLRACANIVILNRVSYNNRIFAHRMKGSYFCNNSINNLVKSGLSSGFCLNHADVYTIKHLIPSTYLSYTLKQSS